MTHPQTPNHTFNRRISFILDDFSILHLESCRHGTRRTLIFQNTAQHEQPTHEEYTQ